MKIPIVNEQDKIIGEEERSVVHRDGILHREIHVWFVTSGGKIIFQKRAENKDTWPGMLVATVGGHVDLGDTYESTAIKETAEETGLHINIDDLIYIDKFRTTSKDPVTHTINNRFLIVYLYNIADGVELQVEKDAGAGFESYTLDELKNLSEDQKKKFPATLRSEPFTSLFDILVSKAHETQD